KLSLPPGCHCPSCDGIIAHMFLYCPSPAWRTARGFAAYLSSSRSRYASGSSASSRVSLRILIKSPTCLSPQPARINHLFKQRTRPVLRVMKPFMKNLHDVQADVETDKVRKLERPHGMIHPQFHDAVHRLGRSDTFHQRIH